MFKVIPGRTAPNEVRAHLYPVCNDAEHLLVVYSARHRGFLARVVCFEGATPDFQSW